QATDEQRAAVADVVIHNDGSIEQLNEKVTRVFRNGFSS
ncbi:hypothetical protein ACOKXR_10380, partial [Glutamicibacter creatinolyticus]